MAQPLNGWEWRRAAFYNIIHDILMKTPEWLDKNEYPFTYNEVEIDGNKLHYIDEGSGEILLMVHGTPDWSFTWRHMVKHFSKRYRCIAMDNLGYGLSDKPEDADYTPEAHSIRLRKFIQKLGLKNINLVVHDFGGPIGFGYAMNYPDNIKRIVIFNTWMWRLEGEKHFEMAGNLFGGWLGKFLYTRLNFSAKVIMKSSFGDKKKLTPAIHNQYIKAQGSPQERIAAFACVKALIGSGGFYNNLWEKRSVLLQRPVLMLWGMKDEFLKTSLLFPKWEELLKGKKIVRLENAGHFVQEEEPEIINREVEAFLGNA